MNSGHDEPVEDVLRAVHERYPDLDMDRFQKGPFKQWRDRKLIRRPVRRPGRGKGPGRSAIYPAGTTAQLLRILEIRAEGGRFDPERTLWRLWWEGWPVEPNAIRDRLAMSLEVPRDAGEIRMWLLGDDLPSALKRMRRRGAGEALLSIGDVVVRLMTNLVVSNWRMKDGLNALYKAGGLDFLRRSVSQNALPDFSDTGGSEGVKPMADSIRDILTAGSQENQRAALSELDDAALEQSRIDLHTITTITNPIWSVVEAELELSAKNAARDFITHFERFGWGHLPAVVLHVLALRRTPVYATLLDVLHEHADSLAADLQQAIQIERQQTKKRPRRRPSGGAT